MRVPGHARPPIGGPHPPDWRIKDTTARLVPHVYFLATTLIPIVHRARRYVRWMGGNEQRGADATPDLSKWSRFLAWAALIPDPQAPHASDLEVHLSPLELANSVRKQFYKDRNYLRMKRRRWAIGAVSIRLIALALSASATILLGLSELSGPAAWGFALSALVTSVTALEPFFNFRSRWISADEALARWHRAEEELTLYVAMTPASALERGRVVEFDNARREEWVRFGQDWLSDRRSADAGPRS